MKRQNNSTTLALTLTIAQNGQIVTLPLTIWLFALWLLAAYPLLASLCEVANRMMNTADMVVAGITIALTTLIILSKEVRPCLSLS